MGQISYQCKLPALHGNLLRFANEPAWNLLKQLDFLVYYNRVLLRGRDGMYGKGQKASYKMIFMRMDISNY